MRAFLLLLAAALIAGCGQTTPSAKDGKDGKGAKAPPAKLGAPDFTVTSLAFVQEFKKDSKAAQAKYKGKTVELTGVVTSIGTNFGGDPVILVESEPKKFDWVTCITAERYPAKQIAPGQKVTFKGRVPDPSFSAGLLDCEIVKAEGPKPQAFTADELADEVGKDFDAAKKKHENKWVMLTGDVAEVKFNEAKAASMVLKTKGKGPKVVALFSAMGEKDQATLKAAKKVEVLGKLSSLTLSKEEAGLGDAVLASKPE